MLDTTAWMNKAKEKVNDLIAGTEFVLKDLFEGIEWNSLPVGDRLLFGKFFKNEVKSGHVPAVTYLGKAQNNSAKYIKEL